MPLFLIPLASRPDSSSPPTQHVARKPTIRGYSQNWEREKKENFRGNAEVSEQVDKVFHQISGSRPRVPRPEGKPNLPFQKELLFFFYNPSFTSRLSYRKIAERNKNGGLVGEEEREIDNTSVCLDRKTNGRRK